MRWRPSQSVSSLPQQPVHEPGSGDFIPLESKVPTEAPEPPTYELQMMAWGSVYASSP